MRVNDTNYFMAAPTRQQSKRIFWDNLKREMQYFIKDKSESELWVRLINGSTILVDGLDKPERLEGSPWDGGLITETGNTKPTFWGEHLRPCFGDTARVVTLKNSSIEKIQLGFCIFDGVPEGRNHYYNMALTACNGVIPETIPFEGAFAEFEDWAYYSWFARDVLKASEIEAMRRDMDERTFLQEEGGQFVSYEGTLYYNFSQANISDGMAQLNTDIPIYLSCDFNKSPLCWGIGQKRGRLALICDEIVIPYNAKTENAAKMFCERFKGHANKLVYLTGDASGNVEGTHDYSTDYMIIEDVLKMNGFRIVNQVPRFNPSVNNRINLACSLFKSVTGEIRCFIHSKLAYLQNDLNRNVGDGKGGKDKTDPQQTHSSDWLDYMIVAMFENEMWGGKTGQVRI